MSSPDEKNLIIIDGSYFVFFRYYAIISWWKIAKKEPPLPENPYESPDFIDCFKRTFIKKIQEIAKKHKMKNPTYIVGKDCSRCDIWRNDFIDEYKANRDYSNFYGKPFFKMAYDELFNAAGVEHILYHPKLEADDCIALFSRKLLEKNNNVNIIIITADHDYMQLLDENLEIFTLKHKPLRTEKNSSYNAKCDLFCKIILGDKSDNIPAVFKRCGKKTALQLWNDKKSLQKRFLKEDCMKIYKRNKKIIDFNEIPLELKEEFLQTHESIINLFI